MRPTYDLQGKEILTLLVPLIFLCGLPGFTIPSQQDPCHWANFLANHFSWITDGEEANAIEDEAPNLALFAIVAKISTHMSSGRRVSNQGATKGVKQLAPFDS